MKRMRRFGATLVVASIVAGGSIGVSVDAAGKKGDQDGQAAVCAYLLNVINYSYVSPVIKLWATSLYNSYGCQPARP